MTEKTYYKDQLKQLKTDSVYYSTVKICDPLANQTKWMDLNKNSIPVLIAFLKKELKNLPI